MDRKVVYLARGALQGTGRGLFRSHSGEVTLDGAMALQRCVKLGIEVVLTDGGTQAEVGAQASLLGYDSCIFEAGAGVAVGGEVTLLGATLPGEGTPYERIRDLGVVDRLVRRYRDEVEYRQAEVPRQVSHVFHGQLDLGHVNDTLRKWGFDDLVMIDDGERREMGLGQSARRYQLVPAGVSKRAAVAHHMRVRGYSQGQCIAIGVSPADAEVSTVVDATWMLRDALADPRVRDVMDGPRRHVTDGRGLNGVLEVIMPSFR